MRRGRRCSNAVRVSPTAFLEPREQPSPCRVSAVRRPRGSRFAPGWPPRRPARAQAPSGVGAACLAAAGPSPPVRPRRRPCPRGPGRRGQPRLELQLRLGQAGPGQPGRPRTKPRARWGRADSGRARAPRMGRAAGDLGTAWSRSRTPHQGRSPSGRGGRLPATARSCRTAHPCRSSGPSSRAVRRSPAAPRCQATASELGRNRSHQPTATAASAPRTWFSRDATRLPRTPPAAPVPR
jgi:hypothetical protein